jgi:hypothetical protein
MTDSKAIHLAILLKPAADYLTPDSSEIRLLPTKKGGGLCPCTFPAGKAPLPVALRQVVEFWYVVSGDG